MAAGRANQTLRNRQSSGAPGAVGESNGGVERVSANDESSKPAKDGSRRRFRTPRRFPQHLQKVVAGLLLSTLLIIALLDTAFSSYGIATFPTASKSQSTTFAVVINTYKRPDRLRHAVSHYARTCGMPYDVGQVFVIWSEVGVEPPSVETLIAGSNDGTGAGIRGGLDIASTEASDSIKGGQQQQQQTEVTIIRVEKDSLNSRFLPVPGMTTDAAFMVDDDVRVDCKSLLNGFQAWQSNSDSMVGYYPRLASEPISTSQSDELVYHTWPIVYMRGRFNMILTKACFLHSKYLTQYSGDAHPREIREYVDRHKNCEDVTMSLLVANATKNDNTGAPLYVEGSVQDTGLFGGISTGTAHFVTRSQCLTDLIRIYSSNGWDNPLSDVQLSERSWLRHYPGFRWQIHPSNFFEWFGLANTFT